MTSILQTDTIAVSKYIHGQIEALIVARMQVLNVISIMHKLKWTLYNQRREQADLHFIPLVINSLVTVEADQTDIQSLRSAALAGDGNRWI